MRGKKHHKAKGGKLEVDQMEAGEGGGDPEVEKEAEEKKRGGKTKKHRKHGGHVDGEKKHHRMDRKRGGRAHEHMEHSDMSPLSSAHRETSDSKLPKEQEGGLSK